MYPRLLLQAGTEPPIQANSSNAIGRPEPPCYYGPKPLNISLLLVAAHNYGHVVRQARSSGKV